VPSPGQDLTGLGDRLPDRIRADLEHLGQDQLGTDLPLVDDGDQDLPASVSSGLPWLPLAWLPAHSWTLHLALAVLFVAEMFGGGLSEHWPAFLLCQAVGRAA
jgi:hypothetical protein